MSKIIDRAGKGAALDQGEFDANYSSLAGINKVAAGTTYTVDIDDQGNTLEFTNAGAVAVALDDIATIQTAAHTSDFHVTLIAANAATVVTITPDATDSINTGVATIVLTVDEYVTLETDSTGAAWNIINSSDASQVGGLSASQFLRSDADDVTTGNIAISKASPSFTIRCANEATENTVLQFQDELGNQRALIYRPLASDLLRLDAKDALAAVQASLLITEAGKVNIATGTLQLAGVDVTSTAAELNVSDGDTAATVTTVAAGDRVVYNDAGVMKQVDVDAIDTYFSQTTKTLTNKTHTSPVINTGVSGTAVLDEDDMASDSNTQIATQQSIKAYVDTNARITSGTVATLNGKLSETFTGIPSWAKKITVNIINASCDAGANSLYLRLGDSGGVEATGYDSVHSDVQINTVAATTSFLLTNAISSASDVTGTYILTLVDASTNTWNCLGLGADNATGPDQWLTSGNKPLSATLDRVQIALSANLFDAGSVNILYEG